MVSNTSRVFRFATKTFNTGTIKARALEPIETLGLTAADVPMLMGKVQEVMLKNIEELGFTELDEDSVVLKDVEAQPLVE